MVLYCCAYNCTVSYKKNTNVKFHQFPKNENLFKEWVVAIKRKNFTPSPSSVVCSNHFGDDDYFINVMDNKVLKKDAVPSIFNYEASSKNRRTRKELDEGLLNAHISNNKLDEVSKKVSHESNSTFQKTIASTSQIDDNAMKISNKLNCVFVSIPSILEVDTNTKQMFVENSSRLERDYPTIADEENLIQSIDNVYIPSSKRRKTPCHFGDYSESDLECNFKRHRYWETSQALVLKQKKKIKYYETITRRLRKKVILLENTVNDFKNNKVSSQ